MFEGLRHRCTFCDLKTHPNCSDSPATYGSPNMGQFVFVVSELLLFVTGSSHWEGIQGVGSQCVLDMHKLCFSVFSRGDVLLHPVGERAHNQSFVH